jgi:hypothetical protein
VLFTESPLLIISFGGPETGLKNSPFVPIFKTSGWRGEGTVFLPGTSHKEFSVLRL